MHASIGRISNEQVVLIQSKMCTHVEINPGVAKITRGDCERFIRGDIQVATGRTMAVPLPRSSPLTRPPISSQEFAPPCRNSPPYAITVINLGCLW